MADFSASIDIAASREAVFSYLVTNEGMQAWMGQWADLDPVPGGDFAVDIAGFAVRGTFLEVDPPQRIVMSWGFAGSSDVPPGASTVTFTLSRSDAGTRVHVLHSGLPDSAAPGHDIGWRHFLPRLAAVSTGATLPEDTWRPAPRLSKETP